MNEISLEKFISEKFSMLEKSTELSRIGMEKRLDSMNEFRDTLKDQAAKFITRNELDAILDRKAGQISVYITMLIAILGLVVSSISLFIGGGK